MDVSWMTKYIAEGLGTMLLVLLGNGTIAGVTLKGSKNEGMGGLAIAKVQYGTWLKWVWKLLVILAVVCLVVVTTAMMIL